MPVASAVNKCGPFLTAHTPFPTPDDRLTLFRHTAEAVVPAMLDQAAFRRYPLHS